MSQSIDPTERDAPTIVGPNGSATFIGATPEAAERLAAAFEELVAKGYAVRVGQAPEPSVRSGRIVASLRRWCAKRVANR